jgi:hypothetical protein
MRDARHGRSTRSALERDIEQAVRIDVGFDAEANVERHLPSRLRLAFNFVCSLARTVSAGTHTPLRW